MFYLRINNKIIKLVTADGNKVYKYKRVTYYMFNKRGNMTWDSPLILVIGILAIIFSIIFTLIAFSKNVLNNFNLISYILGFFVGIIFLVRYYKSKKGISQ